MMEIYNSYQVEAKSDSDISVRGDLGIKYLKACLQ